MFCITFQELCEANKTHSMAIAEKGSHDISSSWRITPPVLRNPTRVSRSRLTNQMILHLISVVWCHSPGYIDCSRASLQHQDCWRRNEAPNQLYCLHKYHNPPVSYRVMHYFVTEMCTCALISLTNDALWDLLDVSIVSTGRPWLTCHARVWAIFKICCLLLGQHFSLWFGRGLQSFSQIKNDDNPRAYGIVC